jgi:predicted nucleotidyltransferase
MGARRRILFENKSQIMEFLDPQKLLRDKKEKDAPVAALEAAPKEPDPEVVRKLQAEEAIFQEKKQTQEASDAQKADDIRNQLGLQPQKDKRFSLSKEDFARERVGAIKEIVTELKNEHPEVLSFCMYGSMVKGTARLESDVDGYLFVDASEAGEGQNTVDNEPKINKQDDGTVSTKPQARFTEEPENFYKTALENKFKDKIGFDESKTKDLKVLPISKEIIDSHVDALKKNFEDLKAYEKAWENMDWEAGGESPRRPDDIYVSDNLSKMFHLEVGGGIRKYRQHLIEKLSSLGEAGDKIWREIMDATATMEHGGIDNARYPKNVEEARKIYGGK